MILSGQNDIVSLIGLVVAVFVILGTCVALRLGTQPALMLFECCSTMFLFYAAHWQAYCSGRLKFGMSVSSPVCLSVCLASSY